MFPHLPSALLSVLQVVLFVMPERHVPRAIELLLAAIVTPGTRTVSACLRILGKADERHFQNDHRLLNRVRWNARAATKCLFMELVRVFVPEGPLVFGLDDTIERRKGAKISKKGVYRDPVRSSTSHFVKVQGVRWMSAMLLCPISWAKRIWAWPFMTVLCPSKRWYESKGPTALTMRDKARQMVLQIRRWMGNTRRLIVVGDSRFAAMEWLASVRKQATVITRLRLDAALFEPAPVSCGKGRPRKKGERLSSLKQRLDNAATQWKSIPVDFWYGQCPRVVDIATGTCVWYHSGKPALPIRWVLIRDPEGKFESQALLCTDMDLSMQEILGFFVRRWTMKVTFQEARAHLDVETQRQWSDLAIERVTPILFALVSLVTLMAQKLWTSDPSKSIRHAAWYRKERPTFSDALAWVRKEIWAAMSVSMSQKKADIENVSTPIFQVMMEALAYAA